jgi:rod shape-determining protein MreC
MPEPLRIGLSDRLRSTVLYPVFALGGASASDGTRFADVAAIRAERDSLAGVLIGQATLAQENRELRAMLGFRNRLAYSFVPAEAVRARDVGSAGTLELSVGRRDGIRDAAAVVTAEGLVGSIWRLGESTAVAIDWTHPEFGVSVMTLDGETYGIAKHASFHGNNVLALTPVAFHTQPPNGALIVTSGDGALYPRGIPVGKVVGSGRAEGGWQRVYYIDPLVSPEQMTHVLVLGDPVRARTDEDLAAAWGVRLSPDARPDSSARVVSPDAAAPMPMPRINERPAGEAPRPRRTRRVDPTPELPGRPVFEGEPRVPEGLPPPRRGTPR